MNETQIARWERARRMGKTRFTALVAAGGLLGAFFPLLPFLLIAPPDRSPSYLLIGVAFACPLGLIVNILLARWSWDHLEEKYRAATSRPATRPSLAPDPARDPGDSRR